MLRIPTIILASILIASCSGTKQPATSAAHNIQLGSCWDNLTLRSGDFVHGEAIALYSPYGPLLLRDRKCRRLQFKVAARSTIDVDHLRDEMAERTRDQSPAAQAFLVELEGVVDGGADGIAQAIPKRHYNEEEKNLLRWGEDKLVVKNMRIIRPIHGSFEPSD